jgi:hypothetical protein
MRGGRSQFQLTKVLDLPTCAIGGIFILVSNIGVCRHHGSRNCCHFRAKCDYKVDYKVEHNQEELK